MKYCSRWCPRARIFDSEVTFVALRTISWYMACRDFRLQVILLPSAALWLSNVSRLFIRLAHRNQDFLRLTSSFAISCRHIGVKVSRFRWVKARAPAPSYRNKSSKRKDYCIKTKMKYRDLGKILKNHEILFQMVSPSKDFRF